MIIFTGNVRSDVMQSGFSNDSFENSLKEGYLEMREINLSIAEECCAMETEAHVIFEKFLEKCKDGV